jgi:hypothetical protein
VLNGTLYDPEDIQRFNGQELHFVPAASRDHILVVDDRDVMVKWWQLSYLSAIGEATKRSSASQDMSKLRDHIPGTIPWAEYHEDVNFQGDIIILYPFSGYNDLTQLSQGLFEGDWNDEISSVRMHTPEHDITRRVTLYEHTHWRGSTLTLFVSHGSLFGYGWNDRASSIEFV